MYDKILNILKEIRPEFEFNNRFDFIEEGMLDSYDIVNLVTALDETFGISIDGLDIIPENFSSIGNIINLLKKNGIEQ